MSGEFHIDPRVEAAIMAADNEICAFERSTGRCYTSVLIPHDAGEPIHLALNGKPVPLKLGDEVEVAIEAALGTRKRTTG